MKHLLIVLFAASLLQGCYLGRQIETPVVVRIESNVTMNNTTTIPDPIYVNLVTPEQCVESFRSRMESSLASNNITVQKKGDGLNADYVIVVTGLSMQEGTKTETVNDADSEFNGQTYELSTCDASATAELYNADKSEKLGNWTLYADKDEKVKNNRTLGQLIGGTNQNNNEYREKLLSDDVFADLSSKCGNRVAAKVSTKIHNLQK